MAKNIRWTTEVASLHLPNPVQCLWEPLYALEVCLDGPGAVSAICELAVESVSAYTVVMDYDDGTRIYEPLVDIEHSKQLRITVKALHMFEASNHRVRRCTVQDSNSLQ